MSNGWTGGQYSLYRGLLGLALCAILVSFALGNPGNGAVARLVGTLGCALALLLATGRLDRIAAVATLALGAYLFARHPAAWPGGSAVLAWLLAAHALAPPAPYGSWAAAGRADPGGGWSLPRWLYAAHWTVLAFAGGSVAAAAIVDDPGWPVRTAAFVALAVPAWVPAARPWLWTALGAAHLALPFLDAAQSWSAPLVLLQLAAFDPAWVRPTRRDRDELLFYDGACGLCHRAVRFVLAEAPAGDALRFAPLSGETFRARLPAARRDALPDSLIVLTAEGQVLSRSAAVRRLAEGLGGRWRILAALTRAVPAALLDRLYDLIARTRHRLFARPDDACPVTPRRLRDRFDP